MPSCTAKAIFSWISEEEIEVPTGIGVRLGGELIPSLHDIVLKAQKLVNEITVEIVRKSKIALMVK